jgi:hypothetical protein
MESHYYVSAKTGYNINDAFYWLVTNIPKLEEKKLNIDYEDNYSISSTYTLCC